MFDSFGFLADCPDLCISGSACKKTHRHCCGQAIDGFRQSRRVVSWGMTKSHTQWLKDLAIAGRVTMPSGNFVFGSLADMPVVNGVAITPGAQDIYPAPFPVPAR